MNDIEWDFFELVIASLLHDNGAGGLVRILWSDRRSF